MANDLTRPIVGIENRTAQEVFDIMVDRFRRTPPPQSHLPPDVFSVHDGGNSITLHFAEIKSARAFRDTFPASIVAPAPEKHVRVKPLEWKAVTAQDRKAEVANSVLGKWEVWQFPAGGSVYIMKPGEHQGAVYEDSYDEAKAYMERVYQRRMVPALAATATEGANNG